MPLQERRETIGIAPNQKELWRSSTCGEVIIIVDNHDLSFEPQALGHGQVKLTGSVLKIRRDYGELDEVHFPRVFSIPERRLLENAQVKWDKVVLHANDIEGFMASTHYRLVTGDKKNGWTIQIDIQHWLGEITSKETPHAEVGNIIIPDF